MWSITKDTTAAMWYSRKPIVFLPRTSPLAYESTPLTSSPSAVTADRPQPQPSQPSIHHSRQILLRAPLQPTVPTIEQRNWLTLMTQNINTAFRPTMVLECTQGELRIRFCSTCNALWPVVGHPPTHMYNKCDNVNRFFPQNILPLFSCYICDQRYTLHDIGKHVVAMHFKVDISREVSKTHACADCDMVMYSPFSKFVQHWYTAHGTFNKSVFARFFYGTLNTHLRRVLAIMGKLTEDFQQNGGRQTLMYACLFCQYVGKDPSDHRFPCNFCSNSDNKFYCEHCNAIFSGSQIAYDIHRLTNQHIRLMGNNQVENVDRSNVVRINISGGDGSNHGDGSGRGCGEGSGGCKHPDQSASTYGQWSLP